MHAAPAGAMPLAFAREGSTVRVVEVKAGKGRTRRLAELGIHPGSEVKIVKTSGPGPVILEVSQANVAPRCRACPMRGCGLSGSRLMVSLGVAMRILVQDTRDVM